MKLSTLRNERGGWGIKLLFLFFPFFIILILYPFAHTQVKRNGARWSERAAERATQVVTKVVEQQVQRQMQQSAVSPRLTLDDAGRSPREAEKEGKRDSYLELTEKPTTDNNPVNIVARGGKEGVEFYVDDDGSCRLRVESFPGNALVQVTGGITVGTTPLVLRGACGRSLVLTFSRDGYGNVEKSVDLQKGGLGIAVRLTKGSPRGVASSVGQGPKNSNGPSGFQGAINKMVGGMMGEE